MAPELPCQPQSENLRGGGLICYTLPAFIAFLLLLLLAGTSALAPFLQGREVQGERKTGPK